jgi:trk system potassium uptake protein TrkA
LTKGQDEAPIPTKELPSTIERATPAKKKGTGRIIIIGGGRIGRHLMKHLPRALLIESSPATVKNMSKLYGADRVLIGDGANLKFLMEAGIQEADMVIITTSKDHVNNKIAMAVAPFGVRKVMVRVTDEESFKAYKSLGMEPFKITPAMSAKLVERIYNPDLPHVHEFILPTRCDAAGRRIEQLNIPEEVTLVSVLRGENLEVPEPTLVLKAGDVLTVIASDEEVLKLEKLLGARLDITQLQRIYVPYKGKKTIKYALREAFVLAKYADAQVVLLYDKRDKDDRKIAKQMDQIFKLQDVSIEIKGIDDEPEDGLKSLLRKMALDRKTSKNGTILYDCIMVDPETSTMLERLLGTSWIEHTLDGIDRPVIITGNMNPYKSILLAIDGSDNSEILVSLAIEVAILFGSRIHVLVKVGEEEEATDQLAQYIVRAGHLYGLPVTRQDIEGNPTMEFVENVKSGEFDLVLINWRSRAIKKDLLRKVVEYGPRSVLVLP